MARVSGTNREIDFLTKSIKFQWFIFQIFKTGKRWIFWTRVSIPAGSWWPVMIRSGTQRIRSGCWSSLRGDLDPLSWVPSWLIIQPCSTTTSRSCTSARIKSAPGNRPPLLSSICIISFIASERYSCHFNTSQQALQLCFSIQTDPTKPLAANRRKL